MKTYNFIVLALLSLATITTNVYGQKDPIHIGDLEFAPEKEGDLPIDGPTNPPTETGGRMVYFTHGFGGDGDSWTQANGYVYDNSQQGGANPAPRWPRLYASEELGYDSGVGIPSGASDLAGKFRDHTFHTNRGLDMTQSFLIGHSFGGLVGRKIYEDYEINLTPVDKRRINGLVSFGTPHTGAGIANSRFLVDEFIAEGCQSALEPYFADAIDDAIPLPWNGFGLDLSRQFSSAFCNGLIQPLANFALADVTGANAAADLEIGSSALNDLNSAPENMYKQAMFGTEIQTGLFWRMSHWFFRAGVANTGYSRFGADSDGDLIAEAAAMEAEYRRQGDMWASRRNDEPQLGVCGHWYAFKWTTCNTMERYRDIWWEGADWIRGADEGYKGLARFSEITTTTVTTAAKCECFTPGGVAVIPDAESDNKCDANCPFPYTFTPASTRTIQQRTLLPNDGVVTANSATAFGTDHLELPGSNHFQMRNDGNTKSALDALLDGSENGWFKSNTP